MYLPRQTQPSRDPVVPEKEATSARVAPSTGADVARENPYRPVSFSVAERQRPGDVRSQAGQLGRFSAVVVGPPALRAFRPAIGRARQRGACPCSYFTRLMERPRGQGV